LVLVALIVEYSNKIFTSLNTKSSLLLYKYIGLLMNIVFYE